MGFVDVAILESCLLLNKHSLTPGRELTTDESKDTTKVQLDEPMCLVVVTYRNSGHALLIGPEVTPQQWHYQEVQLHQ